ncbi:hypothetical protein [Bacillus sp. T3]|uniref:hypothetical protein n=1 Tax=Bacillus sp. T3 TaxID=467262 RepID=UPI0029817F75|nr:hypothetical protein [Bacillus sp. T3]
MEKQGLNLTEIIRSIAVRSTRQNHHNFFELKSKTETKTRRVESSKFLGKTKRLLGSIFNKDWGYETEYYDVEVLDKPRD